MTTIQDSEEEAQLARQYAPVVCLHPDEPFGPSDPSDFIADSHLIWRYPDESIEPVADDVETVRLGISAPDHGLAAYLSPKPFRGLPPRSERYVRRVRSTAFTRPFDKSGQRARLDKKEGFALLYHEATRSSPVLGEVPQFFEVRQRGQNVFICYWLFFPKSTRPYKFRIRSLLPRSVATVRSRRVEARRSLPGNSEFRANGMELDDLDYITVPDLWRLATKKVSHQGDWEGITVCLDTDGRNVSDRDRHVVHFRAHGHHVRPIPFGQVEKRAAENGQYTRPFVYCARGSHACYAKHREPAATALGDVTSHAEIGDLWDSLAHPGMLRRATSEGWYGFGGAWGDPDMDAAGESLPEGIPLVGRRLDRSDFCGPLGPSRYKSIWP